LLLAKRGADNRQAARHQQGSTYSLHSSRQDEGQHRWREPTPDGGQGEDRDAKGKDAPSPVQITQGSSYENERGEKERIGFHNPLHIRGRGSQVLLDHGQGDIDDGAINKSHA
jgi:hypothetical protein